MGLFSAKKQIFVSSSAYNLAGDIDQRPDFLKTVVVGSIITPNGQSLGKNLTDSYLRGPALRLRRYAEWSRTSGFAAFMGIPSGGIVMGSNIDESILAGEIPHDPGQTVLVQSAEIGRADFTYWVDRYMLENHPDEIETDYTADFDVAAGEIVVTRVGPIVESFVPTDYTVGTAYLYATYLLVDEEVADDLEEGSVVTLSSGDPFPDTTGWTEISETTVGTITETVFERTTYLGAVGSALAAEREVMTQWEDSSDSSRSYRIDTQQITLKSWSPLKMLIYPLGSGNTTLDALFQPTANEGDFLPFIPLRINNVTVAEDNIYSEFWEPCRKALKKSINADYGDLIDKLNDNASIGDIDYAYVVFGVPLNTKENAARRYIYEFFQEMLAGQTLGGLTYAEWRALQDEAQDRATAWYAWYAAQSDPSDPLFNTVEPDLPYYPPPPTSAGEVRVASSTHPAISFDMVVTWKVLEETTGFGLKEAGRKPGELWWEYVGIENVSQTYVSNEAGTFPAEKDVDHVRLHWQVDGNSWRTLDFWGLEHRNMIYGGKQVEILSGEALADEEESGFIIPLHEEILKRTPLVRATQMSFGCAYLVLNSYKIVKEKWYQTGWFKVLLIIIIVVITIVTGGAGAGSAGLLGTNAAVGAALGYTGAAAAIAGAIANAIAAMIVTRLLGLVSTALFGDKFGTIIGAIASLVVLQVGAALNSGGSFASAFQDMTKAENLMKLTEAALNGTSGYIKANTAENLQNMMVETQTLLNDYNEQSKVVAGRMEELFGGTNDAVDPLSLTEVSLPTRGELPDTFLARTLMTGDEIAELSTEMLSSFAELTLNTELFT